MATSSQVSQDVEYAVIDALLSHTFPVICMEDVQKYSVEIVI